LPRYSARSLRLAFALPISTIGRDCGAGQQRLRPGALTPRRADAQAR
jgi:hypothetical protein